MANATQADLTADAMRIVAQDLDRAIEEIRVRLRRGQKSTGVKYLALVKQAQELREKAEALGMSGPLFTIVEPRPYRTGFVGLTAEEVRAREWAGVGDVFARRAAPKRRMAA